MKDEYDFSKGERGKFYRLGAVLNPPVHLEPEVRAFLTERAQARGVSLSDLVDALLKKDIELIEAAESAPPNAPIIACRIETAPDDNGTLLVTCRRSPQSRPAHG
jgi:hypothetical protein